MRAVEHARITKETDVAVKLNLDGAGAADVSTGISFFDHLLKTLAVHSKIDIAVKGLGDLKHHIMEDVGITLGEGMRRAIGDGSGIQRFGYAIVPMDDALAFGAIDLVSRPYAHVDLKIKSSTIEGVNSEDIVHFIEALAMSLRGNIHIIVSYGENDHHKVEAAFKALALSFRQAVARGSDNKNIQSVKGTL